jgi:hypothetical protein
VRVTNFPNGLTLTSSALSASDIENLFQLAIMQALGINPGTVTTGTLVADSNQLTLAAIGLAAVENLIVGSGVPAGTVVSSIAGNVVTMSNNASYANTYGAGGYGDMDYGSPSTWSTPVAIGSDAQAFYKVRVGWQRDGQPGWLVKEDVTTVTAVVVDDPYNRIRDVMNAPNDETTVMETTNYTRAWEIHLSVYGPNSNDNARLIKSCTRLQWFRDIVAASNLYLVPNESDPVRAPESFNKQWWDRSDYRAKYYEAVQETITQQTVATAEVILEAAIGGYGSDGYGDNPYGDQTTVTVDITV